MPRKATSPKAVSDPSPKPRFDPETLRALGGDRVFQRGETYQRDGAVRILVNDASRVLAAVAGSETYRTELTGGGIAIGGGCSCPAFEREDFCKHMVAVALAANQASVSLGPAPADPAVTLRAYLKSRGEDALIEMILDLATRDIDLFDRLDMAAAAHGEDDATLTARLRRAIDGATHTGRGVDYDGAGAWADRVQAVLAPLGDLLAAGRAAVALRLIARVIDRLQAAIPEIDDSDGECVAVLHLAAELHLAAVRAVRPQPRALAQDLFALEMEDQYSVFSDAAGIYADCLGAEGIAEYRRLAAEAWAKLKPRSARRGADDETWASAFVLRYILDRFAADDGDLDTRIALRTKDLSSPARYMELIGFCSGHGRDAEALSRAEEALFVFEDHADYDRLVLCAAPLLVRAGRAAEAETRLRAVFTKSPRADTLDKILALSGQAAGRAASEEWAIAILRARLTDRSAGGWDRPVNVLTRLLIDLGRFGDAWAVVRDHGVMESTQDELAAASVATHPAEVCAAYAARVERLARNGYGNSYQDAVNLLARMKPLQTPAEHAAYIADLKTRHARRRNFMKLLG